MPTRANMILAGVTAGAFAAALLLTGLDTTPPDPTPSQTSEPETTSEIEPTSNSNNSSNSDPKTSNSKEKPPKENTKTSKDPS